MQTAAAATVASLEKARVDSVQAGPAELPAPETLFTVQYTLRFSNKLLLPTLCKPASPAPYLEMQKRPLHAV